MAKGFQIITILAILSGVAFSQLVAFNTTTTQIGGQNVQQTHYYFSQVLDHFNPNNTDYWNQQITVYDTNFDNTKGTVFVYIGGEGPQNGLSNGNGWVYVLAQQFNAMVIAVEHRFYGVSQPFGQTPESYTVENLGYLTVDQSLEDLAYIITYIKANQLLSTSDKNPFITIGGSYPGAMSGWFRYKYPHLTVGALASSAVVNSILDFQQYDYQIYTSTLLSGEWCPDRIQKFNRVVEDTLSQNSLGAKQLKTLFNATSLTNLEFLSYFGDLWAGMVQYGKRTNLCDMFKDSELFSSQLENVLAYAATSQTTEGYDIAALQNTAYVQNKSDRQWVWQVCTYFGWFQTANQVQPMRSKQVDIDFYQAQCSDAFGLQFSTPDVDTTNSIYGGKNLEATNIVFTNGVEDEWQWASIRQSQNDMLAIISDCEDCAHCVELRLPQATDSLALNYTRSNVSALFTAWVTEFYVRQQLDMEDHSQLLEESEVVQVSRRQEEESFIEKMLNKIIEIEIEDEGL